MLRLQGRRSSVHLEDSPKFLLEIGTHPRIFKLRSAGLYVGDGWPNQKGKPALLLEGSE